MPTKKKKQKLRFPFGPNKRLGWHLLSEDMRLGYHDKRKVREGKKMKQKGDKAPNVCENGMHASYYPDRTMKDSNGVDRRLLVQVIDRLVKGKKNAR